MDKRVRWLAAPVLALALIWAGYYFFLGGSGKVTAWQLRLHPESSLTYPHSYGASSSQSDEDDADGWFRIENTDPRPALAETQFYTVDPVDRVIAWYEQWLSARGWLDVVVQANSARSWDRGANEEFEVACGHQSSSTALWCDVQYHVLSPRFTRSFPPAPPFGDAVSQEAVQQRQLGLSSLGAQITDPREGTPGADAARAGWPNWPHSCCGNPVILLDASAAEETSPLRAAYHVMTLQAAEYDAPSLHDIVYFGSTEAHAANNFLYAGFVRIGAESTTMFGRTASAYELVRDNREAVFYAISYGPAVQESGYAYRVTTMSIIYDVVPMSCPFTRTECFDVVFKGDAATGWLY